LRMRPVLVAWVELEPEIRIGMHLAKFLCE